MTLLAECRKIAKLLASSNRKIVFAESCTAGLVSASLARVPGISDYLCGSAVTYRNKTKENWLGIPAQVLKSPGPVSENVARRMAEGVLEATPEADLGASVTGHLGPNAPADLDGLIYVGIAVRQSPSGMARCVGVHENRLKTAGRYARQCETTMFVLAKLREFLAYDRSLRDGRIQT